MNPITQMRQHLDAELQLAEQRFEQRRLAANHERNLLNKIEETFCAFAGICGIRANYVPYTPVEPWGWFLYWRDHEVANACLHKGEIHWRVCPPFSAPADFYIPYALNKLHWRSHRGDFHRFGEAMARVVAEISVANSTS